MNLRQRRLFSYTYAWSVLMLTAVSPLSLAQGKSNIIKTSLRSSVDTQFHTANQVALFQNAQYWYVKNRPDLTRESLNKLLLISPQHANALLWQGLNEVRFGEVTIAEIWLKRLEQLYPNSHQVQELKESIRLASHDKQALLELRYLSRSDKITDPIRQYLPKFNAVFPNGPSIGEAGIQYYELLRRIPGTEKEALTGLERMHKTFPDDPRYLLPLAKRMLYERKQRTQAVQLAQQSLNTVFSQPSEVEALMEELRKLQKEELIQLAKQTKTQIVRVSAQAPRERRRKQDVAGEQIREQQRLIAQAIEDKRLQADEKNKVGRDLIAQGRRGEGLELLEDAVNLNSESPWLRYDLAKAYDDMGDPDTAREVMRYGLTNYLSADMRFASALLSSRQKDPSKAREYLAEVPLEERTPSMDKLARTLEVDIELLYARRGDDSERRLLKASLMAGNDSDATLSVAQAWQALGKPRQAVLTLENWLKTNDGSSDSGEIKARLAKYRDKVLIADLQTLREEKKFNQAAKQLAELPLTLRTTSDVQTEELILKNRKQGYLATGFESSTKSGIQGSSEQRNQEIPIVFRHALDYERHVFLHLDRIDLNAGSISGANSNDASALGKVAALGLGSVRGPLNQNVAGHVLGLGMETEQWRADIGKLPEQFPISDWVGGLRYKTDIGKTTVRLEGFRRAVTSSLVSYAGAKDPVTNETWGGVRKIGLSAFAYHPIDNQQAVMADLTVANNRGREVPDNRELYFRTSYSRVIYQNKQQEVEVGSALMLWSFEKNLRFYNFGQGGYYSPQRYASLSLPVQWSGKTTSWSWLVRGQVGYTSTYEKDTPLFPSRDDLQQLVGNQVNTGGNGGGVSYGLTSHIEHTVLKQLQYGVRLQMDRSANYAPNRLFMYVRYWTDGPLNSISAPEAVRAYSKL